MNDPSVATQSAPRLEIPSFLDVLSALWSLAPSAFTLLLVIALALVLRRWLERSGTSSGHKMRNQLILLAVTGFGLVLVVLLLPIGDTLRGQVLSLIGLVLSAGIALSSTTFLGNMLAGIMLRAVRSFRMGDFISCGEHFGRVSERGLFHTEIQTEERNLTTLPNLYLVTHPVTTVRASGTVVAATVSLGYDVSRTRIEQLLLAAAKNTELDDPFVTVMDLGDFSVTYRISGLLTEVKSLITARSRLRSEVLDALHGGGVEIVSPTFMNTRPLADDRQFIPESASEPRKPAPEEAGAPEDILFDKAEEAEEAESLLAKVAGLAEQIETLQAQIKEAPEESRASLEKQLSQLESARDRQARKADEIRNREEAGD
ncbi:MAG: mechanosensitive ion channel family protein [marine benthic group bacterium]|nr:mechanosensitive ion channel family protein [Candidatus Benthicola marisminoris]